MNSDIIKMTATELAAKIKSKELSSVEVTKAFLERIKEVDPKIKAYVSVCEDYALKQAQQSDDKIAKGENAGVLEGVPIAIKDNILIKDIRMTASSKILENYIAPYDATVITKLKWKRMMHCKMQISSLMQLGMTRLSSSMNMIT